MTATTRPPLKPGRPDRPRTSPLRVVRALGVPLLLGAVLTAAAPGVIQIQRGDTLWDLAREHDTSVQALRKLNNLPSGQIYAGDALRLPQAPAKKGGDETARGSGRADVGHTVRPGDTVLDLAIRYRVKAAAITDRNRLARNGLIVIGRRLVIPGGGAARVRGSVAQSAAAHRATLADRPQPSRRYVRELIVTTARQRGVDPALALAIAKQESGFQQRVVSPDDAIGVMQVLPSTGRWVSSALVGRPLDLLDVEDNVTAGVAFIASLDRATGSRRMLLAGYYQGLGSVSRRGLLPQTKAYIRNVEALRQRYA